MTKYNYVNHLEDKDKFVSAVKDDIRQRAFVELENMKKEMASDFLKTGEEK